ncbi:lysine N(6)-hydroxylase/L-ornithine N(5)-oxygenase family protein [Micromonospora sp. KC606]|uniref:lysine N(6)-hydroxylase/L-ornithine N(5)-oxygenase family protein n=1 Tax=Micromonospora sp. KC606 TaxID=2530379 RepID=UPI001FB5A630|nr:lysine N(6)-hydroxylase/L-ornithine N(5)-oxygenase family protein [Micromonospora sp. KC606]
MDSQHQDEPILDILGIGFGPSNLALAIAVFEHNRSGTSEPVTAEFLERKPEFGWHRGMLIDGATMQVSFLKDLVSLRDPTSRFSFLSYLHDRGRLIDFINHKCLFPSRIEFHDYLAWCAARLEHLVRYGQEVVSVRPVYAGDMVTHFEVLSHDQHGNTHTRLAHNIVVAAGLVPRFPDQAPPSPRVWHSHDLLYRLDTLPADAPTRFVVLGAGQSAAEVAEYLYRSYPDAEVCALFSRFGYSQSDDSPFANRIFDPGTVDIFHAAPDEVRGSLLAYHSNTNYSAVDVELIEQLYRRSYAESIHGTPRLRLLNVSRLVGVRDVDAGPVEVVVRRLDTGSVDRLTADALICATGYEPNDPLSLLGHVGRHLRRSADGRLRVDRDYRIAADPALRAGVYLCGGTEHTHGISSSLLSNTAIRAGEILASVVEHSRVLRAAPLPFMVASNAPLP